jgi:hypothetical protein
MKTTYITFKREMARAYAEYRKRMTRRVTKWPKWIQDCDYSLSRIAEIINSNDYRGVVKRGYCDGIEHQYRCPYGAPGDQLILGTTWATLEKYDNRKPSDLPTEEMQPSTPGSVIRWEPIPLWSYFDSDEKPEGFGKLRPGRFLPGFLRDRMPHETLKIVRAEQIRKITEDDAISEGIDTECEQYHVAQNIMDNLGVVDGASHSVERGSPEISVFKTLWDSINAGRGFSWASNPWVWVLGW